jgi:endonuclease-3
MAKEGVAAIQKREKMGMVLRILKREYPEAECSLHFETPFQLLIATILSAQCTDARVNLVTPRLFAKYPTAEKMAKASLADIERLIKTVGFFRAKALSLQTTARALVENHGGQVPQDLEALILLRGVGRKTANVVLGVAFKVPGLVVDTHVKRLCFRIGFTTSTDPVKIEQQMMTLVPKEDWTHFAHLMICHGRAICIARRPKCEECPLTQICSKKGVVI